MSQIEFLNEKGNARVKIRNEMRNQILDNIRKLFTGNEIKPNEEGGFSVCLGEDLLTGAKIYAHIGLTLNAKEPYIRKINTDTPIPQLWD